MPKIRVVKSKEEAEKIPVTEPIDFDLSEQPPVEIIAPGPQGKDETVAPVEPTHKAKEPQGEPVEAAPDLLKQLETLKKAEVENKRKLEEAERARAEAEQRAQQQQRENREVRQSAAEAQLDSVVNAISAVQADADTAQGRYAAAMAQQDFVAAAEAQRVMSRSESRLAQLEMQKEHLEKKAEEKPPEPVPVTGASKVDQVLNSMPGLSTQERTWLRDHPDAVLTPVNLQRLEVAYRDATDRGIARNSDEYFRFFADRLGYKDEAAEPEEEPVEEEEVTAPAPKRYSAPPSRASVPITGSRDTSTRITLSPEHRQAAKWSGVDENEYAKGLLRLKALKQDGFYND